MRYPEHHKAETREKIVAAASRALRAEGLDGISVPALMQRAGLTHGGFYSHFKNREHLVAEAIAAAANETASQVFEASSSLQALKARYLSEEHVQRPEFGCVVAALGSEGHRQSEVVKQAFAVAADGLINLVSQKCDQIDQDENTPSNEALRTVSMMVGAVVLARLVRDDSLATRILEASRG
ncbi:MAG: TetR/AcrR family transcriptional regulator [Burkholderiales bacterium]|nr:TetR/AcrR family transcriptional regulator [Burkholderiales bacterium]